MGTRSHIYVQTDNGYMGAYCQYDGYPEHMYHQIDRRSYDELLGIILKATTTGGFRALSDSGADYYSSGSSELLFLTDPECPVENSPVDYIYIRRFNGETVYRPNRDEPPHVWRRYDGAEWDLEEVALQPSNS